MYISISISLSLFISGCVYPKKKIRIDVYIYFYIKIYINRGMFWFHVGLRGFSMGVSEHSLTSTRPRAFKGLCWVRY